MFISLDGHFQQQAEQLFWCRALLNSLSRGIYIFGDGTLTGGPGTRALHICDGCTHKMDCPSAFGSLLWYPTFHEHGGNHDARQHPAGMTEKPQGKFKCSPPRSHREKKLARCWLHETAFFPIDYGGFLYAPGTIPVEYVKC